MVHDAKLAESEPFAGTAMRNEGQSAEKKGRVLIMGLPRADKAFLQKSGRKFLRMALQPEGLTGRTGEWRLLTLHVAEPDEDGGQRKDPPHSCRRWRAEYQLALRV